MKHIIINKKTLLIVSCVWLVLVIATLLLVIRNIKFPIFNDNVYSIFSFTLMFIIPVFGIIVSVIPDEHIKPFLYGSLILCFLFSFLFIFFITFGFEDFRTPLYPISMSSTNKPANYMVVDDVGLKYEETMMRIEKVFPDKIPSEATDVIYKYECEPFKSSWRIEASWKLPKEQYYSELERIKNISKGKIEENDVIYYDVSTEEVYFHVGFYEKDYRITYINILGYFYDYRKVRGIGGWQ